MNTINEDDVEQIALLWLVEVRRMHVAEIVPYGATPLSLSED